MNTKLKYLLLYVFIFFHMPNSGRTRFRKFLCYISGKHPATIPSKHPIFNFKAIPSELLLQIFESSHNNDKLFILNRLRRLSKEITTKISSHEKTYYSKLYKVLDVKDRNYLCIAAIRDGHKSIIKKHLQSPSASVCCADNKGNTMLIWAVLKGYTPIFEKLLTFQNINVNHKNNDGNTALMLAINKRQTSMVEKLLNRPKTSVHDWNNKGETALILAAKSKQISIIKLLLKLYPYFEYHLNRTDFSGWNALDYSESKSEIWWILRRKGGVHEGACIIL